MPQEPGAEREPHTSAQEPQAPMTGRAAPAVTPLVYVGVVAGAGLLALAATAVPGRTALRARPVTATTAKE
ncbi:hypothetical protein [Streptomyces sp. NL15-2K]|uniref:hypothetical protein n=1 Tax=Streptomyces sp. NL15-2K TaxID=376149 RepID=UPI000F589FA1|nr:MULTISPECIES: hypothetical protein [Actinomycetes]WKX13117.1 hypothetical protein Q4V64_38590 [Kutzneria buriramensis]